MAYEVTRVHLEMSVETYDEFRAWEKERTNTETELERKYSELLDVFTKVVENVAFAVLAETDIFERENRLRAAYNLAKEFRIINK